MAFDFDKLEKRAEKRKDIFAKGIAEMREEAKKAGASPLVDGSIWEASDTYSLGDTSATAAAYFVLREHADSIVVLFRNKTVGEKSPSDLKYLPTASVRSKDGVLNGFPGKFSELADTYLRERANGFFAMADSVDDEGIEKAYKNVAKTFAKERGKLHLYGADMRRSFYIAWEHLSREGFEPLPLRARLEDVDASSRYVGAANGVVDLAEGVLVPPSKCGRILVETRADVDFDPNSKGEEHWAVAKLFGNMDRETGNSWLDALAFALFGDNRRRLYFGLGPRGSGKTTLLSALRGALGGYVQEPPSGVFGKKMASGVGQNTPELAIFCAPARYVILDEPERKKLDDSLLKQISGGRTWIAYTPKNLPPTRALVTSSTFIFTNEVPDTVITEGSALRERATVIPYPALDMSARDTRLKALFDGTHTDEAEIREAREAVLAALVRRAGAQWGKDAPELSKAIVEASQRMAEDTTGALGQLLRELQPKEGAVLHFLDVWKRFAALNEAPEDFVSNRIGGFTKVTLSRHLEAGIRDLRGEAMERKHTNKGSAFVGWTLDVGGGNRGAGADGSFPTPQNAKAHMTDE